MSERISGHSQHETKGKFQDRQILRHAIRGALAAGFALSCAPIIGSAHADDEAPPVMSDWGGARTKLREENGVTIGLNYIAETLAVTRGGINQRASYEGRFEFVVDTDLEKLTGLANFKGASTHLKIFNIHNGGRNAAANAGSIADPSNIDALPTTRLFTAWYQHEIADGLFSLRFGQLAADDEFLTSETAGGLINGTFGWAGLAAANIRSGGPAYPLATPGARAKIQANENLALLGAVFSGDPTGRNCTIDPQRCNFHGTTFSFAHGALILGEVQYAINPGKNPVGLPGVYKVGFWHATTEYADQRLGIDPATGAVVSLADPAFTPDPLNHRGNWGIYGVVDQMIWRGNERSVNVFMRGGFTPNDRNVVSAYIDGGIGIKGLIEGRSDDKLTFGVAHAKISNSAVALDRDTLAFNGPPYPIRNGETLFEVSYVAQIAPYWSIQPDIQYIVRPSGGVPHPNNPNAVIGNAFIVGARTTINF